MGRAPFPTSIITRHRYNETILLDPSAGVPSVHYFNAIGMYDPNSTGTGHQPLGFDQYTPIYDHYTVLGSKITVDFTAATTSAALGANKVCIFVNDDASAVTTWDTIMEQGGAVSKILTGSNAGGTCRLSKKFSTKKFFGVTDVKDNDQLKGSNSANPLDGAYFAVLAQGMTSSDNPNGFYANVMIEYITQWSEPRSLNQS